MGKIVFVTGPVRSGKSRFAQDLARAWGDEVVYVATYRIDPSDLEMRDRIRRHQSERPAHWRTLEDEDGISAALLRMNPAPSGVIVDCLTMWLARRLGESDDLILAEWSKVLDGFKSSEWATVIVGNEVGWSLVPADPQLRRFRDLAGWLSQATARASDETHLLVAGCSLRLK